MHSSRSPDSQCGSRSESSRRNKHKPSSRPGRGHYEKVHRAEKVEKERHARDKHGEKRQSSSDRSRGDKHEFSASHADISVHKRGRTDSGSARDKSRDVSVGDQCRSRDEERRGRKQISSSSSSTLAETARATGRSRSPLASAASSSSRGRRRHGSRSPDDASSGRDKAASDRRERASSQNNRRDEVMSQHAPAGRWAGEGSVSPCDLTRVKREPDEPEQRRAREQQHERRSPHRTHGEVAPAHPAEVLIKKEDDEETGDKQLPDFGLSGLLAADTNTCNGVVVKYSEPAEARQPRRRWRLYVFKGDTEMPTLHIHRQSGYLIGRDRKVADIPVDHPSCSKQHAALQFRLTTLARDSNGAGGGRKVRPYVMDLQSANGTFVNNKRIDPQRYVELFERDVIKFGFSTREYVLLHEHSKEEDESEDEGMPA